MPADEPTLGEVARTLERFERTTNARFADLQTAISLMVTRDLYEAHRTALLEDMGQLRDEIKAEREARLADQKIADDRKAADRRMAVGAFLGAGLAIVVAVVTALLKI